MSGVAAVANALFGRKGDLMLGVKGIRTSPEIELLLCCARTSVNSEQAERIRDLTRQDIHWLHLIATAHAHGIIPLIYRILQTTCPEVVPKTVMDQLRDHFNGNALHNFLLTEELIKLLALF